MHLKFSFRCQFSSSYIFLYAYNYLPPEKPVCRSGRDSQNWTWKNGLFQDWERSTSRLYIVTPLITLYAVNIMQNAGLDEAQAGIKISGRNINIIGYADDTTSTAENKELKSLLMKVKEESEKDALKLNVQKTKIMASGPITSWQIDGETMERVTDLFSWAPKSLWTVTAAMKLKDPRRSNQSVLKEINPEYSLEGLMLKLKLQ